MSLSYMDKTDVNLCLNNAVTFSIINSMLRQTDMLWQTNPNAQCYSVLHINSCLNNAVIYWPYAYSMLWHANSIPIPYCDILTLCLYKVLKWLFLKKTHSWFSFTVELSSYNPWYVSCEAVLSRKASASNAEIFW